MTLESQGSIPPDPRPPGFRAQIGATRDAALGLVMAHIDLAKAEAEAIGGEIGRVAAYVGIAIALIIFAVILLVVGGSMFLAEWLFGSIGWGVLHGVLLFIAVALACSFATVGMSGRRIGVSLAAGIAVGVIVALLLGLGLLNQAYAALGETALPNVEPGVRPLVVGVAIWGVVGLVVGLILALRMDEWGGRIGALLGAAALGAMIGALTSIVAGLQVGVALGIAAAYLTWIAVMAADMARTGVDVEALQARFMPTRTIETSKETLAWLLSKMPHGSGS